MIILESLSTEYYAITNEFVMFACNYLGLESIPPIELVDDASFPEEHGTFGIYNRKSREVHVATEGRHLMDVFRTLAHELVHYRQTLQGVDWSESELEAEANTVAALVMREYAGKYPSAFSLLKEDGGAMMGGAPVNNAGSGGVAGIGVGKFGEPGVNTRKRKRKLYKSPILKPIFTRKAMQECYEYESAPHIEPKKFAGAHVFQVDSKYFHQARMGKKKYAHYKHYVGNDEVGESIRHYGNRNYGKPIVLQDRQTGAMLYLRYGKE